jgi:hypothetical protein
VKRGKVCKYFATKRAGRKQGSRSGIKAQQSTTMNIGTQRTNGVIEADMTQMAVPQDKDCYTDMLPESCWLPTPDSASAPDLGHFMLDDIFGTSAAMTAFESPSVDPIIIQPVGFDPVGDIMGSVNITSHLGVETSPWSTKDTAVGTPTVCSPHAPPTSHVFNQLDLLSLQEPMFNSACSCLPHVLELVKGELPSPHQGSASLRSETFRTEIIPPSTVNLWLGRERKAVEAIHRLLTCQCSWDSYVISIISLTIFKVTVSYKTAADELLRSSKADGKPPTGIGNSSSHFDTQLKSPTEAENCELNGNEQDAVAAAQRLLYNFNRLQRLVNAVSQKLSNHRGGKQGMGLSEGMVSDTSDYISYILFPIFSTTFTQLEIDLSRQRHAISAKFVGLSQ